MMYVVHKGYVDDLLLMNVCLNNMCGVIPHVLTTKSVFVLCLHDDL